MESTLAHNILAAPAGGALIGLSSGVYIFLNGRVAGISGIVGGVLVPGTDAGQRLERVWFIAGLLVDPLIVCTLFYGTAIWLPCKAL